MERITEDHRETRPLSRESLQPGDKNEDGAAEGVPADFRGVYSPGSPTSPVQTAFSQLVACQGESFVFRGFDASDLLLLAEEFIQIRSYGERDVVMSSDAEEECECFLLLLAGGLDYIQGEGSLRSMQRGEIVGALRVFVEPGGEAEEGGKEASGGKQAKEHAFLVRASAPRTLVATFPYAMLGPLYEKAPDIGAKLLAMLTQAALHFTLERHMDMQGTQMLHPAPATTVQIERLLLDVHKHSQGLGQLTFEEIGELAKHMFLAKAEDGEAIIAAGQEASYVVFIVEGAVRLQLPGGEVVGRRSQGELMGERKFLLRHMAMERFSNHLDWVAEGALQLLVLPVKTILQLNSSHPLLTLRLLCQLGKFIIDGHHQRFGHKHKGHVQDDYDFFDEGEEHEDAEEVSAEGGRTTEMLEFCRCYTEYWQNISKEDVLKLEFFLQFLQVPDGALILKKGEPATFVAVLLAGSAEALVGNGQRIHLSPGEWLGEMAVFTRGPRVATIVSNNPGTVIAKLSFEGLETLYKSEPELGMKLVQLCATSAVTKLQKKEHREMDLAKLQCSPCPPPWLPEMAIGLTAALKHVHSDWTLTEIQGLLPYVQMAEAEAGMKVVEAGELCSGLIVPVRGGSIRQELLGVRYGEYGQHELVAPDLLALQHKPSDFDLVAVSDGTGVHDNPDDDDDENEHGIVYMAVIPLKSLQGLDEEEPEVMYKLRMVLASATVAMVDNHTPENHHAFSVAINPKTAVEPPPTAEEHERPRSRSKTSSRSRTRSPASKGPSPGAEKRKAGGKAGRRRRSFLFAMELSTGIDELASAFSWGQSRQMLTTCQQVSPLWKMLSVQEIATLAQVFPLVVADKGTPIFRRGEDASFVALLVRGAVDVVLGTHVLDTHGPGSILGVTTLFVPGQRGATAVACEDSVVAVFSHTKLEKFMKAHPQEGFKLMQMFSRTSCTRLQRAVDLKRVEQEGLLHSVGALDLEWTEKLALLEELNGTPNGSLGDLTTDDLSALAHLVSFIQPPKGSRVIKDHITGSTLLIILRGKLARVDPQAYHIKQGEAGPGAFIGDGEFVEALLDGVPDDVGHTGDWLVVGLDDDDDVFSKSPENATPGDWSRPSTALSMDEAAFPTLLCLLTQEALQQCQKTYPALAVKLMFFLVSRYTRKLLEQQAATIEAAVEERRRRVEEEEERKRLEALIAAAPSVTEAAGGRGGAVVLRKVAWTKKAASTLRKKKTGNTTAISGLGKARKSNMDQKIKGSHGAPEEGELRVPSFNSKLHRGLVQEAVWKGSMSKNVFADSQKLQMLEMAQQCSRFWFGFTEEEIQEIAPAAVIVRVEQGEKLMTKGEAAAFVALMVQGEGTAYIDGEEINSMYPGDLMGEMALFHRKQHTADIVAGEGGCIIAKFPLDCLVPSAGFTDSPNRIPNKLLYRMLRRFAAAAVVHLKEGMMDLSGPEEFQSVIMAKDKIFTLLDAATNKAEKADADPNKGLGGGFSRADLVHLVDKMFIAKYRMGDRIFRAGQEGTAMALVVEGTAQVQGRRAWRKKGEMLGETSFVNSYLIRPYRNADVNVITENCWLGIMTHGLYLQLCSQIPDLAFRLMHRMAFVQANHLCNVMKELKMNPHQLASAMTPIPIDPDAERKVESFVLSQISMGHVVPKNPSGSLYIHTATLQSKGRKGKSKLADKAMARESTAGGGPAGGGGGGKKGSTLRGASIKDKFKEAAGAAGGKRGSELVGDDKDPIGLQLLDAVKEAERLAAERAALAGGLTPGSAASEPASHKPSLTERLYETADPVVDPNKPLDPNSPAGVRQKLRQKREREAAGEPKEEDKRKVAAAVAHSLGVRDTDRTGALPVKAGFKGAISVPPSMQRSGKATKGQAAGGGATKASGGGSGAITGWVLTPDAVFDPMAADTGPGVSSPSFSKKGAAPNPWDSAKLGSARSPKSSPPRSPPKDGESPSGQATEAGAPEGEWDTAQGPAAAPLPGGAGAGGAGAGGPGATEHASVPPVSIPRKRASEEQMGEAEGGRSGRDTYRFTDELLHGIEKLEEGTWDWSDWEKITDDAELRMLLKDQTPAQRRLTVERLVKDRGQRHKLTLVHGDGLATKAQQAAARFAHGRGGPELGLEERRSTEDFAKQYLYQHDTDADDGPAKARDHISRGSDTGDNNWINPLPLTDTHMLAAATLRQQASTSPRGITTPKRKVRVSQDNARSPRAPTASGQEAMAVKGDSVPSTAAGSVPPTRMLHLMSPTSEPGHPSLKTMKNMGPLTEKNGGKLGPRKTKINAIVEWNPHLAGDPQNPGDHLGEWVIIPGIDDASASATRPVTPTEFKMPSSRASSNSPPRYRLDNSTSFSRSSAQGSPKKSNSTPAIEPPSSTQRDGTAEQRESKAATIFSHEPGVVRYGSASSRSPSSSPGPKSPSGAGKEQTLEDLLNAAESRVVAAAGGLPGSPYDSASDRSHTPMSSVPNTPPKHRHFPPPFRPSRYPKNRNGGHSHDEREQLAMRNAQLGYASPPRTPLEGGISPLEAYIKAKHAKFADALHQAAHHRALLKTPVSSENSFSRPRFRMPEKHVVALTPFSTVKPPSPASTEASPQQGISPGAGPRAFNRVRAGPAVEASPGAGSQAPPGSRSILKGSPSTAALPGPPPALEAQASAPDLTFWRTPPPVAAGPSPLHPSPSRTLVPTSAAGGAGSPFERSQAPEHIPPVPFLPFPGPLPPPKYIRPKATIEAVVGGRRGPSPARGVLPDFQKEREFLIQKHLFPAERDPTKDPAFFPAPPANSPFAAALANLPPALQPSLQYWQDEFSATTQVLPAERSLPEMPSEDRRRGKGRPTFRVADGEVVYKTRRAHGRSPKQAAEQENGVMLAKLTNDFEQLAKRLDRLDQVTDAQLADLGPTPGKPAN